MDRSSKRSFSHLDALARQLDETGQSWMTAIPLDTFGEIVKNLNINEFMYLCAASRTIRDMCKNHMDRPGVLSAILTIFLNNSSLNQIMRLAHDPTFDLYNIFGYQRRRPDAVVSVERADPYFWHRLFYADFFMPESLYVGSLQSRILTFLETNVAHVGVENANVSALKGPHIKTMTSDGLFVIISTFVKDMKVMVLGPLYSMLVLTGWKRLVLSWSGDPTYPTEGNQISQPRNTPFQGDALRYDSAQSKPQPMHTYAMGATSTAYIDGYNDEGHFLWSTGEQMIRRKLSQLSSIDQKAFNERQMEASFYVLRDSPDEIAFAAEAAGLDKSSSDMAFLLNHQNALRRSSQYGPFSRLPSDEAQIIFDALREQFSGEDELAWRLSTALDIRTLRAEHMYGDLIFRLADLDPRRLETNLVASHYGPSIFAIRRAPSENKLFVTAVFGDGILRDSYIYEDRYGVKMEFHAKRGMALEFDPNGQIVYIRHHFWIDAFTIGYTPDIAALGITVEPSGRPFNANHRAGHLMYFKKKLENIIDLHGGKPKIIIPQRRLRNVDALFDDDDDFSPATARLWE